jgi:zinc transport system substrate-binding protein
MRKFILFFSFLISFAAAHAQTTPPEKVILTSFYPVAVTTLNIISDVPGVRLETLAPQSAGCLHDYQLNPADMKKLDSAKVLVLNGAGAENFLKKPLRKFPALVVIDTSKGIELIHSGSKHHHGHHDHGDVDEHIWLSVSNVIQQSRTIAEALSAWDPAHKTQYMKNFENYSTRLTDLKKEINATLAPFKNRKIVTFHQAFSYFAREFGLVVAGVIETSPGMAPDPKTLGSLVTLMKEHGLKAVFTEPQYPARFGETLARQTGAEVYSLDTFVSGKLEKDSYLAVMKANAGILARALAAEGKK